MPVSRLYLHAGLPKTGSSSIQLDLFVNRSELLDQGILYPETGMFGPGHHMFAHYGYPNYKINYLPELYNYETDDRLVNLNALSEVERQAQFKVLQTELLEEFEKFEGDTAVLSSEAFSNWEQEQIAEFCDAMKTASVELQLIFYLRRQDELLDSLLGQNERALYRRFDSPQDIEEIVNHNAFDFNETIRPWTQSLGRDNVSLKPFAKLRKTDHLIADFRSEIGVKDDSELQTLEPVNTSLTRDALDFLIEKAKQLDRKSLHSLNHVLGDYSDANPDNPLWRRRLNPEMRQKIAGRFSPSNFMLAVEHSTNVTELLPEAPVDPDEEWSEYPGLSDAARETISEYVEKRHQQKKKLDEPPD